MVGSNARLALRIRASMSEIGSFIKLPTGFGHARNQAVKGAFAESHAGAGELAEVSVTPSAHRAAVHHSDRAGIAWKLGQAGIIALGLEFGAQGGVLFDRFGLLLVAFNPCFLSHNQEMGCWGAGVIECWSVGVLKFWIEIFIGLRRR